MTPRKTSKIPRAHSNHARATHEMIGWKAFAPSPRRSGPTTPMTNRPFVHLHCHTDYSLLDGACAISQMMDVVGPAAHAHHRHNRPRRPLRCRQVLQLFLFTFRVIDCKDKMPSRNKAFISYTHKDEKVRHELDTSTTTSGSVLAFNIDAHLDVRSSPGSPQRNAVPQVDRGEHSPTPVLLRTRLSALRRRSGPPRIPSAQRRHGPQCGPTPRQRVSRGDPTHPGERVRRRPFLGLDMDFVRASDAPGVSAPNPAGLYAEDVCHIASLAAQDPRSRIFEITEVNPDFDIDGRTARLAAAVVFHFLERQS